MALLTEGRQFVLGLAMMAADPQSGLSQAERRVVVAWVQAETCPPYWRPRIQRYLDRRAAVHTPEEEPHG